MKFLDCVIFRACKLETQLANAFRFGGEYVLPKVNTPYEAIHDTFHNYNLLKSFNYLSVLSAPFLHVVMKPGNNHF